MRFAHSYYIQRCAGGACNRFVLAAPRVMIPTPSMPSHTQQQPLRKKLRTAANGAVSNDNTVSVPAPSAVGTGKQAAGRGVSQWHARSGVELKSCRHSMPNTVLLSAVLRRLKPATLASSGSGWRTAASRETQTVCKMHSIHRVGPSLYYAAFHEH
jgi:hypothetical protein